MAGGLNCTDGGFANAVGDGRVTALVLCRRLGSGRHASDLGIAGKTGHARRRPVDFGSATRQTSQGWATLTTTCGRTDRVAAATTHPQTAERQVLSKADTISLGTRHCANGLAAATSLLTPHSIATPIGGWLLAGVGCWAIFRLATRSPSSWLGAVDLALVLAVCASIPAITNDPYFHESNTAPLVIAGTAVVTFTLIRPARSSVPIAMLIAAAYAWGAAGVIGWDNLPSVGALYYFVVQWATATLLRRTTLRVAAAVDWARTDRKAAAMNDQVSSAIRDNEREHLALLHDTAASTLLLVGQGAALQPDQLAAQARRDLAVLAAGTRRESMSDGEAHRRATRGSVFGNDSDHVEWLAGTADRQRRRRSGRCRRPRGLQQRRSTRPRDADTRRGRYTTRHDHRRRCGLRSGRPPRRTWAQRVDLGPNAPCRW